LPSHYGPGLNKLHAFGHHKDACFSHHYNFGLNFQSRILSDFLSLNNPNFSNKITFFNRIFLKWHYLNRESHLKAMKHYFGFAHRFFLLNKNFPIQGQRKISFFSQAWQPLLPPAAATTAAIT
jgi:hypothetical protein